jgi:rubrerythrin
MDKEKYLDTLKSINLRPKFKRPEHPPKLIMENVIKKAELLKELFIQAGEIEKMEDGEEKDKQILRLSIVAELDAVNLYERFAEITSDDHIRDVMLDVANEEKVHIGEFKALLEELDDEHEKFEDEGKEEVEEIIDEK